MDLKHKAHTINNYLDDKDFFELVKRLKQHGFTPDDCKEPYYEDTKSFVIDMVNDFINDEAINEFGYKYGNLTPTAVANLADDIIDYFAEHYNKQQNENISKITVIIIIIII